MGSIAVQPLPAASVLKQGSAMMVGNGLAAFGWLLRGKLSFIGAK